MRPNGNICKIASTMQKKDTFVALQNFYLTMPISKAQIKRIKSLHQSKFRASEGLFLVEGKKGVEEALASSWRIRSVYSTQAEWCDNHKSAEWINIQEMQQISALNSPSEHLACVEMKETEQVLMEDKILYLDGIRDPGNLGAIIRSAHWFGWKQLVLSPDCVDYTNPKVVQSTMGSIFHVSLKIDEDESFLSRASDERMQIWGADLKGHDLRKTQPAKNALLVIGSESHGIRDQSAQWIKERVNITNIGGAESLNAAIAASIILYQWS
jgi:TrmH family RNA methyltransferase